MTILVVVAMEAEAAPVRSGLGLDGEGLRLHPAFPARLWRDNRVAVAVNGRDERFHVDAIGSQPAVTTTLHAIEVVQPTLVISAGTAGGFEQRGGAIGATYVADRVLFHDRRVDLPGFDRYGDGDYPVEDLGAVAAGLGFETGTISTGNALDTPDVDLVKMHASNTVAKDMEAAAVAWTCDQLGVPFSALKVITDLVDHHEEAADQFLKNLRAATNRLAEAVPALIDALTMKPRHTPTIGDTMNLGLSADEVLTTTRSVRKRLDLDRPVERSVVEECLDIALQAPTGSNTQGWQWVFVTDPEKKKTIADFYGANFDLYTNRPGQPEYGADDPRTSQRPAIMDSAGYLREVFHQVPVMMIPCISGEARLDTGVPTFGQASAWGSLLPAVWSFMLALRERGLGSAWTTLHLPNEREVAELLGIPYDTVTQAGLFPIAYTLGTDFKLAKRLPAAKLSHWDEW